jgi:hypothetical protein
VLCGKERKKPEFALFSFLLEAFFFALILVRAPAFFFALRLRALKREKSAGARL